MLPRRAAALGGGPRMPLTGAPDAGPDLRPGHDLAMRTGRAGISRPGSVFPPPERGIAEYSVLRWRTPARSVAPRRDRTGPGRAAGLPPASRTGREPGRSGLPVPAPDLRWRHGRRPGLRSATRTRSNTCACSARPRSPPGSVPDPAGARQPRRYREPPPARWRRAGPARPAPGLSDGSGPTRRHRAAGVRPGPAAAARPGPRQPGRRSRRDVVVARTPECCFRLVPAGKRRWPRGRWRHRGRCRPPCNRWRRRSAAGPGHRSTRPVRPPGTRCAAAGALGATTGTVVHLPAAPGRARGVGRAGARADAHPQPGAPAALLPRRPSSAARRRRAVGAGGRRTVRSTTGSPAASG